MYRTIASLIVFGTLTLLLAGSAGAVPPYQFAQFHAPIGGQPFAFTNNGVGSASIGVVNAPVVFNFTAATGLSTADHAAFLNISPTTVSSNETAFTAGVLVDQPLNLVDKLTITSGMNGTGIDYLTMTFTGDITGFLSGPVASILGADNNPANPRVVSYTTDFGFFEPPAPGNSYNLGLQDIAPALSVGADGLLNSFVSNVAGQFSGNFVPEPSSVVLSGCGIIGLGLVAIRRKKIVKARG